MQGKLSFPALVLTCALAAGCGAHSGLDDVEGAGGRPATPPASADAGAPPVQCGALTVTDPADVDVGGAPAERPALVFGTNNGQVVSVFHALSGGPNVDPPLQVTTLTPWQSWPPGEGDRFVADPHGGRTFAVGDDLLGNVGLLFWHADEDAADDEGLDFSNGVSATIQQYLNDVTVAPGAQDPEAGVLVRGYDTPPVAPNVGYVQMLVTWDDVDPTSGAHALELGISTGQSFLFGITYNPDDPDLACASGRIAASAVRAGESWLVLTAAGSDLVRCDQAASAGPPTTLAVDRVAWGPPDGISWTVSRADSAAGGDVVERVRMIPLSGGGLGLVQRGGHADLVRVDDGGLMHPAGKLEAASGTIVLSEILALEDGILLAHVDSGAPDRVALELRGTDGATRASTTVIADAPIGSLTALSSKGGDAALLGWSTSSGHIQLARVGCAEGT